MIKVLRYLGVAIESILAHKMRAILTMLGIIIGVASVMTTVGMGQGARQAITADIESEGVNLLTINAGFGRSNNSLTVGDAAALANPTLHPELAAVVPEYTSFAQVVYADQTGEAEITGTIADYATVRNLKIATGRFFNQDETEGQQRVAVLSDLVAKELFKDVEPLGQRIRIQNEPFQVIGVLSESGSGGFSFSGDRQVYVPLAIAQGRLFSATRYRGEYTVTGVNVQVADREQLKDAEYRIERTLRLRHNLDQDDENDFMIFNQARFLEFANTITRTLTLFLGSIGAVSLLVGGIGIMNIMLVSVTERTREIGLRKALGAHDGDILLQFLIEALVLTTLGGAMGVGLSYGIGFLISLVPDFPLQVVIEIRALLLALAVSLFSGLVFGIYPAIRATRLDPIEALRYE